MEPDFGGYVTKAGLRCSDGRIITAEAFKRMHQAKVPLVWQHAHGSPTNVLGHVMLDDRGDGIYGLAFCNETEQGKVAKALVEHGDIVSFSIYANNLVEKDKYVLHGVIREVSLVLSGANPGAKIDFVRVQHSEDPSDYTEAEDEAIIYTGLSLHHGVEEVPKKEVAEETEEEKTDELKHQTAQEVYESLTPEQKDLLSYMVSAALEASAEDEAKQSDDDENKISHEEGNDEVTRNVFEQNGGTKVERHALTHADVKGIVADAMKIGSLKEAVEAYAIKHGIEDIDLLFPDAKTLNAPEWNKRRTEWVAGVLNSVRRSPFSRVKSIVADITQDQARALGYIKGNYKKEEWFGLTKRVTTPTTIYKKQKLDRDDILDITDFDVVAWLKGEMRLMLEEEIARSILIGDGRDPEDEDKIKDPGGAAEGAGVRSIKNDNELYATTVYVNVDDSNSDYNEVIESIMRARRFYKGSGQPTFYTTNQVVVEMLLSKDSLGRRRWLTKEELASALMVADIVEVEAMEQEPDLLGIIVNLSDYNVGADRGGEVNMFDDFDIDYNQYKYLMETRISGALVKIKSALIIMKVPGESVLAVPTKPSFVSSTGVVTIPTVTGVVYKNKANDGTLSPGAQSPLTEGSSITVIAVPDTGYYFSTNAEDEWTFTRPVSSS